MKCSRNGFCETSRIRDQCNTPAFLWPTRPFAAPRTDGYKSSLVYTWYLQQGQPRAPRLSHDSVDHMKIGRLAQIVQKDKFKTIIEEQKVGLDK